MPKRKLAQTDLVLRNFELISRIPRCSGNERELCDFLLNWAKTNDLFAAKDKKGNVLIRVPATPGSEQAPVIVLQGHLDMVCEKEPGCSHDFSRDPIQLVRSGDWLRAKGTSLGADNGLAIALAMAFAVAKVSKHSELELLFTVDEEIEMSGVAGLAADFFRGRILLNLDSEHEGELTVGCAGGNTSRIVLPHKLQSVADKWPACLLRAAGMRGGHSGLNINEGRANALKVLARVLQALNGAGDIFLAGIKGGTADNAIPREAEAVLSFAERTERLTEIVIRMEDVLQREFAGTEPELRLSLEQVERDSAQGLIPPADLRRVTDLLLALPHGVWAMSTDIPGLVETSSNLASIDFSPGEIVVVSSQRSSVMSRLHAVSGTVAAAARLAGATVVTGGQYSAWQPDFQAPLLQRCRAVYTELFKTSPQVKMVHAGVECGVIADKIPGMQMISFGPTIENPHSPAERLYIPSIDRLWRFLERLLESFC